jgi:OmpA-OmpF porin, OOP family
MLLLAAGVALAGCNGNPLTSTDNVKALNQAAPQAGNTFTGFLAREYADFANNQLTEADWSHADLIARKGLVAARGEPVPPEKVSAWSIPADKRGELESEGARLVAALDGGARERAPQLAAHAQGQYDCWMEEQEEDWESADIAACRSGYLDAMNQLSGAVAAPAAPAAPSPVAARQYQVYFDFDRSNVTEDGRRIVAAAAQAAKQNPGSTISLVGRADTVGSDAYNLALGERRARAVADALMAEGIARDRITLRSAGKREPPVPTPQGVREARNRVVDIAIR